MADIRPFRGIRYALDSVEDLDKVITQPYDKVTPELKQDYLGRHENNFVKLILPDGEDKYRASGELCNQWLADGVLKRDDKPALYVYHQEFSVADLRSTRKGFIGVFRVDEFERGTVLPHERTLSKPKADRLDLTRASRKDFEQIFMLYSDPDRTVDALLEPTGEPDITGTDDFGVVHRVWTVTDEDKIGAVQEKMKDMVLLIADGHHRYETALNVRQETEAKNPGLSPDAALRFKTAAFVNVADPGLVIFPTHRLVRNLDLDWNKKLDEFRECFDLAEVKDPEAEDKLKAAGSRAFVLHTGKDRSWLMTLKHTSGVDRYVETGRSSDYKDLDVTILHSVIIENLLGIPKEKIENHIKYEREAKKAMARVDSAEFQACFLMNPTRVEQVQTLAAKGERMPQKSTDFYPKLISGLVFHDISEGETV
ncbi:MAG: DUF1015 domain-containing protein [candidate division WOR-3 bacterium]|nr:MAG: DUF1015 domain-containing protein [candidate division WOR-3 bacterium]